LTSLVSEVVQALVVLTERDVRYKACSVEFILSQHNYSRWIPGFDPRPMLVRFMLFKLALGQDWVFPCQNYSTRASYMSPH